MPIDRSELGGQDIVYPSAIPFVLIHLGCLGAFWSGVSAEAVILCVALYLIRMFAICAGYHRYFSHRSYSTGRIFQFILAFLAQSTAQKSVLWWAAKHRDHHQHSDTERDVHSPRQSGFFYSHIGWIFVGRNDAADLTKVSDLARVPELRWLHKYERLPPFALGGACFAIADWSGVVVGFLWSTVLLYHATFCINSLAHVRGRKRYLTGDDSRNNWLLALATLGEGWHNNHHACQSSVRQGFRWWELDPTYYILKLLAVFGIVKRLKSPSAAVIRNEHRVTPSVLNRAAAQLAARFNTERIAAGLAATLHEPELTALRARLTEARHRTAEILANVHLPHLPDRKEFLAEAQRTFAQTPSLDAIVERAREMLLTSIGIHLIAGRQKASS